MRSLLGRFHRPNARSQSEQMFMLNNLGDGSTLSLDFTTGVLDPRLTFTRSTTGTYINSSGYVTSAAINAPRFDYDPTTQTPRGLLIEGAATNLALRSNDLNTIPNDGTNWAANGYTRGDVSTTLPDGTTGNACRISGTGSSSFRSAAITVLASTVYTFSFWARNNGGSQARYRVWNVTAGSSIVDYTLSGSNYVSQIGGENNTSTTWVRVSVPFTTPVGCTSIYVYPTSSDSGTVDVLYWGAQVESGSAASSYIPTVTSTGSRAADLCVMNDITSCNYSTTNGSMYYEGRFSKINTASFPFRAGFTKETGDERCFGFLTNSGGSAVEAKGPSATPTASVGQTIAANTDYKIAWSLDASLSTGEVRKSSNGSVVSVSGATGLTATGTPTYFMFGQKGYNDYFPCGTIKAFKYWPTTLSDAQLQGSTT